MQNTNQNNNPYERKGGLSGRARIIIAIVILALLAAGLIIYDRVEGYMQELSGYNGDGGGTAEDFIADEVPEALPTPGRETGDYGAQEVADGADAGADKGRPLTAAELEERFKSLIGTDHNLTEEAYNKLLERYIAAQLKSTGAARLVEPEARQPDGGSRQETAPSDTNTAVSSRKSMCVEHFFAEGGSKVWFRNYDTGEVVIEPEYDGNLHFYTNEPQTYLAVKKAGKYGVIDLNNNIVVPFEYDRIDYNGYNGYWRMVVNDADKIPSYGALRRSDASMIIPVGYEDLRPIEKNFVAVKKDGLWGAVDENNRIVIPIKYHGGLGTSSSSSEGHRIYLRDDDGNTIEFDTKGRVMSRK